MKPLIGTLGNVVGVTAGITACYLGSVVLNCAIQTTFAWCGASIVALWWMVIRILKDPCATSQSFDDYFYQDREDLKRCQAFPETPA